MSASLCKLQKQIFLGEMFTARSGARIMKLPGTEQICVFRCREKGLISPGYIIFSFEGKCAQNSIHGLCSTLIS